MSAYSQKKTKARLTLRLAAAAKLSQLPLDSSRGRGLDRRRAIESQGSQQRCTVTICIAATCSFRLFVRIYRSNVLLQAGQQLLSCPCGTMLPQDCLGKRLHAPRLLL